MKVTDYISVTIDRFPKWYVFTYSDFPVEVSQKEGIYYLYENGCFHIEIQQ